MVMRPNCPKCSSTNSKKNGHAVGRQRWKCKACGHEFTRSEQPGKFQNLRAQAVGLYQMGYSSNQISAMLHVSPTSVLKWARQQTFPTGRVYEMKPRCKVPEKYKVLFEITDEIASASQEFCKLQQGL
jgi:transposase-like protein